MAREFDGANPELAVADLEGMPAATAHGLHPGQSLEMAFSGAPDSLIVPNIAQKTRGYYSRSNARPRPDCCPLFMTFHRLLSERYFIDKRQTLEVPKQVDSLLEERALRAKHRRGYQPRCEYFVGKARSHKITRCTREPDGRALKLSLRAIVGKRCLLLKSAETESCERRKKA